MATLSLAAMIHLCFSAPFIEERWKINIIKKGYLMKLCIFICAEWGLNVSSVK